MQPQPTRGLFAPNPPAPATPTSSADPHGPAIHDPLSRRQVLRWAGWGSLSLLVGGWVNGFLTFFYPRKTGAFGGLINAGPVGELQIGQVKSVVEGKFYLSRVPEGLIALWWKCPHLGCVVPWQGNEQVEPGDEAFAQNGRFHCPCHGSRYNRYGQIIDGPAQRPMDRFPLSIVNGQVIVNTNPSTAIVRQKAGPPDVLPLA